ncbi:MAG: carbonic anhydrase [Chlamydiales bacterium]|nr:carbonic anhydrase [Chlamydiales bacterium]
MKKWIVTLLLCSGLQCSLSAASSEPTAPKLALERLIEGNKRFYKDKSEHPNRTEERRLETAGGQHPYAIILGCSDSRVAPEIIFDEGIGDLFIVRVAGNVLGPIGMESIHYSAIYLNSAIIVVLGHESCGAVQAVLNNNTKDIETIATQIKEAADRTKGQGDLRLENTIKLNAKMMVQQLKNDPVLSDLIKKKKLDIVGGYYDFHTGKVEILTPGL